jgi:hypothetical protein
MPGFDAYESAPSMYRVHKFMNLDFAETTYFIQQVGLAAASFGVAESDIEAVAKALNTLFNVRCAPPTAVIPAQGEQLQSICTDEETCPLAQNATCALYEKDGHDDECSTSGAPAPTEVPGNGTTTTATTSWLPTPTEAEPTTVPTGGAVSKGVGFAAIAAGVAAFML